MDSHSRPIKLGRKQALGYPKIYGVRNYYVNVVQILIERFITKIKMEQHIVIFVIIRKADQRIGLRIHVI